MKHKHCDLIKAWAEGEEIQHFCIYDNQWFDNNAPAWSSCTEYRIKPKPKIVKFKVALVKCNFIGKYLEIIFDDDYSKMESNSDFIKWLGNEYCYEVEDEKNFRGDK